MRALFNTLLYQPILNAFVGLYNIIPDIGVVIIAITLVIKIILHPLTRSSLKAQKSLTDLQPKLEEIKNKHKNDQQKLAQETMRLYKENKVNPLGSCLPILLQLPIFIAIYWVLLAGLNGQGLDLLYPFVPKPNTINTVTLGLTDLSQPNFVLALLAGLSQFWQAKMMQTKRPPKAAGEGGKDENIAAIMNKQMLYFMPALTVLIGMKLPGGLALYWFVSTLLTALQQKMMGKKRDGGNSQSGAAPIEGQVS